MHVRSYFYYRKAFTLIELLVVIAIIAILSVVVILTLNPAELLRQSRDSNRLSDLDTLNHAISLYSTDQSAAATFNMGSSSIVYVSIPDPTATSTAGDQCQGLNLPTLVATSGYAYHCAATSTVRNTDGTGWIPLNFKNISSGSPLGNLPIDPTNTSSSRSYYTYTTNGTQYEITAAIESQKYDLGGSNDVVSTDGGSKMSLVEKGTNLTLEPLDYGDANLIGYWTLDEGTSTVAYDMSGSGNTGSWNGTAAGTNGFYAQGKIGSYSGFFNSTNNSITVTSTVALTPTNNITMSAWVKSVPTSTWQYIFAKNTYAANGGSYYMALTPTSSLEWGFRDSAGGIHGGTQGSVPTSTWAFVAAVYNGSTGAQSWYINGVQVFTSNIGNYTLSVNTNSLYLGAWSGGQIFNGSLDDLRLYSRALSSSEIQAIYNAQR